VKESAESDYPSTATPVVANKTAPNGRFVRSCCTSAEERYKTRAVPISFPRLPRPSIVFLCCLLACLPAIQAQVVIAEFMAVNTNTNIVDEDGNREDWLELHNAGTSPVSLNGWYLTDDHGDLRKWQFPQATPAVTLAAGARLLVWCSDKNRKASATRLHTNFKLDSGGEYLALVRPDGLTVEHQYPATYPVPTKYPPQATDISYGISGGRQWNVLAGPALGTQWRVRVPQTEAEFTTTMAGWNTNTAFDAAAWTLKGTVISGGVPKGIGYDYQGSNGAKAFLVNYSGSPNGVVNDGASVGASGGFGMYASSGGPAAGAPTLAMRTTFTVADPSTIQQLRLNVRYDDGFILYLNGNQVLAANAPTPAWNALAASDREDDLCEEYNTIALPGAQSFLMPGTNLVAIHAFNEAKSSGNFLITPSLEGFQAVAGAPASAPGYLASPTPGEENTIASTVIGPDISQTTKNPAQPVGGAGSPPLLVTARVRPTLNPVSTVTCRYLLNFGSETTLTMRDDGTNGDVTAGDEIFSALVPTTGLSPGHLLRWRIVAADSAANQSTDPPYRDPLDNDQYFGTMAQTPTIQSQLPVLYWFHNSGSTNVFATSEGGFRSALFYKLPTEAAGRFYDNVRLTLHGQSTAGFAKKSQNVNFNADNRFKWREGEQEISGMNLLSNYADKSHVRNTLAWETWNVIGHPSHWCQPVRVQQITAGNLNAGVDAQFLCISDMVEDGNARFLRRWGLDENGALYKCYNSLENVNQSLNGGNGIEKKTREFENFSDLQALQTAMNTSNSVSARRQWLYDNVDVPGLINYLAVHNLISSHDYGHKNYYIYRDTLGTGEWTLLPWDQDLSFGHRWTSAQNYFDDDIDSASSILLGGAGNRLMNIINTSGATELTQMYVRRLATLREKFLGPPSAPSNYFSNRIAALLDLLDPPAWPVTTDAERDFTKWGFWVDGSGTAITNMGDARAPDHRLRPSALRMLNANDPAKYPTANPYSAYGSTANLHSSVNPWLAGRHAYLHNQISGAAPTLQGQLVPTAQTTTPPMVIENVNFNPGSAGQAAEFFVIRNPNAYAVDLSDWRLAGAVEHTFRPGTVIPAQGTSTSDGTSASYVNQLIVTKKPQAFRARSTSPKALEYRLVQGGYQGQLSARGETIELRTADGTLVTTNTYPGAPLATQNFLRVTELNFAPTEPTTAEAAALPGVKASDFEFIELINTGTSSLALGGAYFDKGITFTFPAGFTLAAGARTLVVSNTAAFALRYGSGFYLAGQFEGNFDNGGETVQLLDASGEEILEFTYDDAWYPPADGAGYTLVVRLANPAFDSYGHPLTWALGAPGGSPGSGDANFAVVYEGWRHDYFTSAELSAGTITGLLHDSDGDLDTNLYEYAFGGNPRANDGHAAPKSLTVNVGGTDYAAVQFTRRKNEIDLTYLVEVNSDLAHTGGWTAVALPVGAPLDLGNGLERVTYRDSLPQGIGSRYFRVRALK
jgi:hypothetical protein